MKNTLRIVVLGLVMISSFANYGLENDHNEKTRNTVIVKNAAGETIYTNQVNFKGDVTQILNFKTLDEGVYTVEVDKAFQVETTIVKVLGDAVVVEKNKGETIFKPVVRTKNNTLLISKLGLDTHKMTISIYYEYDLIYSEVLNGESVLNRALKLDDSAKGNYKVIIKANGKTYTKNFNI